MSKKGNATTTTGNKRKAPIGLVVDSAKNNKKLAAMKSAQIDMSVIPESLKREGYDKEFIKDEGVPDYLKCPSCKEIFVNPEMFSCGHSICSVCLQSKSDSCPVCKGPCYNPIPNYIVKELLTREYPEDLERRMKEYTELKTLKEKLQQYQRSIRFNKLYKTLQDHLKKNIFVNHKILMAHLTNSHKDLSPPPTEDELSHFLSIVLRVPDSCISVGQYLICKEISHEDLLTWVDTNKKKGIKEIKKWVPIVSLILAQRNPNQDTIKKLAGIYKLEIGDDLPVEEWRGRPPFWVKDLHLEVTGVHAHFLDPIARMFLGGLRNYDEDESDGSFSDSEYSSDGMFF